MLIYVFVFCAEECVCEKTEIKIDVGYETNHISNTTIINIISKAKILAILGKVKNQKPLSHHLGGQ